MPLALVITSISSFYFSGRARAEGDGRLRILLLLLVLLGARRVFEDVQFGVKVSVNGATWRIYDFLPFPLSRASPHPRGIRTNDIVVAQARTIFTAGHNGTAVCHNHYFDLHCHVAAAGH